MKIIHNKRVLFYECTIYHRSTGSSSTCNYEFTQELANRSGLVLHSDGVDIEDAIKYCRQMTKMSDFGDIRYTYNIPSDIAINHIQP